MSNTKSSMENWRGQNEISVLEGITAVKDEDNMASDSSTALVTQQSVKAYVDTQVSSEDTLAEMNDTTLSSPADNDFLVHDGTDWKNESASTALGSLGVTSTAAELNIMDGSATTQATVTLAGTDGVVISDGDVMKQALVSDFGAFVLSDTLDDAVTINESGADKDFRVEGSGAANALFVQGSDGNVGIGTTGPDYKLEVAGDVALGIMAGFQTEGILRLGRADQSAAGNMTRYHDIKGYIDSTAANNYLTFAVHGGTENVVVDVLTLKGNGNVGIGVSPTVGKLDISGVVYSTGRMQAASATMNTTSSVAVFGSSSTSIPVHLSSDGDLTEGIRVVTGGSVGIGTTAPKAVLTVSEATTPSTLAATDMALQIYGSGSANTYSSIGFSYDDGDNVPGIIAFKTTSGAGMSKGEFGFYTRDVTTDTQPTQRMVIDSAGNVDVKTGNLVIGTSGKGIDFSATSDAGGMSSEVLDDYEEGTWTPALSVGASGYITQTGTYTKIGNVVQVEGTLATSGTSGSGTGIKITGLPFTIAKRSPVSLWADSWGTAPLYADAVVSTTTVSLYSAKTTNGNGTASNEADMNDTSNRNTTTINFVYRV